MSTQAKEKCPLCLETMDLTDKQLKPCKCGYEICLWCWHHIMEMDQKDECGGRCPGCRSIYNKNRILGTGINNQILKGICADRSNLQKEQTKPQKQKSVKNQLRVEEEHVDLNNVRVIQRNLVYIVGMPSEFAKEKVLRQKNFLGQYGKIENIIIDNVGANQQIPDSGRVYVTFSREEEAIRCIEAVNGYILDGRLLRATFGVTRYCHVWLNNKVCRKSICSYVHKKAPPEDICNKDDVALVCARLHQMLGMDLKGLQQRSGSTLPSPGDCNSRTTNRSEILKDKPCINDAKVLSNVGYNNPGALSVATPRDSSVSSANSLSVVNATLHQQNNHKRILNDQESSSVSKFQELPPLVLKDRLNEQLASSDDKSQESTQLGNDIANSKQMTLAGNGTVHTALSKPHYVNIVSQGSSGSGRRFTVLTRQGTSTDARSKTTGQVGNLILNSEKVTSAKDEHSDGNAIPRCHNALVISQGPEGFSHEVTNHLALSVVKSHSGAEEKNACSDISDKPVQEKHMYLSGRIGLRSSAALQSSGASHMLNNLPTSDTKSLSVGPDILSDSHRKLASVNQLQTLDQQKNAVTDTDIACASARLKNQVLFTDSLHQTSAQGGDQSLYNREMTPSREQISSNHADSVLLPSTSLVAKDSKGRKREVCPPGFEELHHLGRKREVCPSKFVSVSSSTCSATCSTSDTVIQDLCSLTCQSDIISWVSECLDDDGDNRQSNSGSVSSTLSSSDPTWGCKQFPGRLLQRIGGVENTMRCCGAFPPASSSSNQKPEHWNGSANGYMSTRGYDAFCQNPTSGIKTGTEGTLLQQPSPPTVYHSLINGNADSGFKSSQVDLSYPMYSLFG